jgi:hypothetical protein
MFAIEKDEDLQATLRGKHIKVLDSDFLTFAGPDKFDLIIMNPPFRDGAAHLQKALDIMYRGQVICLLNAETLRNPFTSERKSLVERLSELNAEIEYIDGFDAFAKAERPTKVDVALVNVRIDRQVEDDLFAGIDGRDDEQAGKIPPIGETYEVSTGRRVEELVREYQEVLRIATETIISFYSSTRKIGKYLSLTVEDGGRNSISGQDLTGMVQNAVNATAALIRKDFWRKVLDLPEVVSRLTAKKREEFHEQVEKRCQMDFNEHNIRTFVLNLIHGYKKTLREAVVEMFDRFSARHSWHDVPWEKNRHYFNGWKTNDAFKINRRIVVPFGSESFTRTYSSSSSWGLGWNIQRELDDIDIVMNYFDGMAPGYTKISDALKDAFARDENTAESTYFSKIIAHKKGTLHLTFRDEGVLRRFNLEACKGKGWLPEDYGKSAYRELDFEHQGVVDAFEGQKAYDQNLGQTGLPGSFSKLLAIEAPAEERREAA